MKTKVTILGKSKSKKGKKKIEFTHWLSDDRIFEEMEGVKEDEKPREWKNIELICSRYYNGEGDLDGESWDLMFAYNNDRNMGKLYIGHFNDGTV